MSTRGLLLFGGGLIGCCAAGVLSCSAGAGSSAHVTPAVEGPAGTPLIGLGEASEKTGECASPTAAREPIRRISRIEYDNAVNALFGVTGDPASGFVPEEKTGVTLGFNTNIDSPVSQLAVEQYVTTAEQIADGVVTSVAGVTGCATSSDTACITAFLTSRARRAWHGTLPESEKTQLVADYTAAVAALGADQGLRFGVESVILSPRFLYPIELGSGTGDVVPLTGSEIAGRLAATLWRSVPDDALLADADAGKLDTADGVMDEALSMLDARANPMLADFVSQWLDVEATPALTKDVMTWADFTPQVADDMLTETEQFFTEVANGGGGFPELFTADYTMMNADLAAFYGVKGGPSGAAFEKTALPSERRGVLTQGSVIANHSHFNRESIVLRGKMVRIELLCDPVSPPPPSVNTTLPAIAKGTTERDLAAAHASVPYCAGCHKMMDPIGYGFGAFDAVGKYVPSGETIQGILTLSGSIAGSVTAPALASVDDVSGPFSTPTQLSQKLADSKDAQQCYVIQSLRYAMGRNEVAADACSAAATWDRFEKSGLGLKAVLVAVTGSDTFRYRTLVTAGEACK
jgi:Protein of unknown function (DUF1592)/Protein of unknown function (DUF1588)/Protein of unknown function (DUF1585)/Protein of unknown function (DUF1587)